MSRFYQSCPTSVKVADLSGIEGLESVIHGVGSERGSVRVIRPGGGSAPRGAGGARRGSSGEAHNVGGCRSGGADIARTDIEVLARGEVKEDGVA